MSNKQKIKPLMYIVQPEYKDVPAQMQAFVVKKKSKKEESLRVETVEKTKEENLRVETVEKTKEESLRVETVEETKEESLRVKNVEPEVEDTKEELLTNKPEETQNELEVANKQYEDQETIKEEKTKRQRKIRKPISKMSIAEKVEFFTTLPKNMPRSLCVIETVEGTFRGVIMSEEEGTVTIRSLNHPKPIDILIENINVINVLGF